MMIHARYNGDAMIAVTGHRPNKLWGYDNNDPNYVMLQKTLEKAIVDLGATKVITGMALGVDQIMAKAAINTNTPFIAAIPFKGQESQWPRKSQNEYNGLLNQASETVIVSPGGYSPKKMMDRNQYMIDRADIVIAVHDGSSGGTRNAVAYATRQNKPLFGITPQQIEDAATTGIVPSVTQWSGPTVEIKEQSRQQQERTNIQHDKTNEIKETAQEIASPTLPPSRSSSKKSKPRCIDMREEDYPPQDADILCIETNARIQLNERTQTVTNRIVTKDSKLAEREFKSVNESSVAKAMLQPLSTKDLANAKAELATTGFTYMDYPVYVATEVHKANLEGKPTHIFTFPDTRVPYPEPGSETPDMDMLRQNARYMKSVADANPEMTHIYLPDPSITLDSPLTRKTIEDANVVVKQLHKILNEELDERFAIYSIGIEESVDYLIENNMILDTQESKDETRPESVEPQTTQTDNKMLHDIYDDLYDDQSPQPDYEPDFW